MNYSRVAVVAVSVVLLTIGLGVGLGVGLKPPPSSPPSCYSGFQRVENQHQVDEVRIESCPSRTDLKCPKGKSHPPLIVLSLDGFRAEYLLRNMTPNLATMSQCGLRAPYMRAAFPTKTFPNHYTIATGLYPESHGIIDNLFHDLKANRTFTLSSDEVTNKRWYHGEPIWNTAMMAGKKVLAMLWPGTAVDIQDMRPDVCYNFNGSLGFRGRIEEVLTYFDSEDATTHPDLTFIYLEQPDSAGHNHGPYGDWVHGNLTLVDNLVGLLVNGVMKRGYKDCVNFIVVADHGMEKADCNKAVNISEYLDSKKHFVYSGFHSRITSKYFIDFNKKMVFTNPNPVPINETLASLSCTAYNSTLDWYVRTHLKEDLPKRYHYSNNQNIDDIVLDIQPRFVVQAFPNDKCFMKPGGHGSDNTYGSMHAIFLGMGSLLKQKDVEPFENIELYNLFADLVNIKPVNNNGTYGRLHFTIKGNNNDSFHPDTCNYKECPIPDFPTERFRIRNNSGLPPLNSSCFAGLSEEYLDKKLVLTKSQILESLSLHLPLEFPGSQVASNSCKFIQKDFINAIHPMFHMPHWTAFTLRHNKSSPSNVLKKDWLSDKNAMKSCVRADVRDKEMINYSKFENKKLGIKKAFLFPPGFTTNSEDISDSHVSSNIVPMYEGFETGVWREMLHLIEEYSEKYELVNVLLGPIFDHNFDGLADQWSDIKEFVDETKQVAIPSHYFVILTRCNSYTECSNSIDSISFVLPHKNSPGNCWDKRVDNYLRENVARIKDVELLTGLNFIIGIRSIEFKTRAVTFLAEKLWPRLSWLDARDDDDDDNCPKLSTDIKNCKNNKFPLLLISLDGFKPDYLKRNLTPTISRLHKCGSTHSSMTSVYPTMTFPNHFSIVTGLYPESHGIIDNKMYDVTLNQSFYLDASSALDSHWWNAEPLWSRLIENNKTAMALYWPGSDVEILGKRPTDYEPYVETAPSEFRVNRVLDWLEGSLNEPADLVIVYFSVVDDAGHDGGPHSVQVQESLVMIDKSMSDLMDGIYKRNIHQCVDVVVVSDHGMSKISPDKEIKLKEFLPEEVLQNVYIYESASPRISTRYSGEHLSMVPVPIQDRVRPEDIVKNLTCKSPNMTPYLKQQSPTRFHYSNNNRIDEILLFLNQPWVATKNRSWRSMKGYHGWDPLYESMKALFIGWGPSFKRNYHFNESFENIELYNLLTYILRVPPSPNNGTWGSLHHLLQNPPNSSTSSPPSLQLPNYFEINETASFPDEDDFVDASNHSLYGCPPNNYQYKKLNMISEQQNQLEKKHVLHGKPSTQQHQITELCILHHNHFVSVFNKNFKLPIWSSFKLMTQPATLNWSFSSYIPDVRVSSINQSSCSDFNQSGISFVPLFHPELSEHQNDCNDALLITNIVPMYEGFIRDVWSKVLVKLFQFFPSGNFMTGPVFDKNGDGIADVLIRANDSLIIPSHYFIIAIGNSTENPNFETASFVFPNSPKSPKELCQEYFSIEEYMSTYRVRIRDVEIITGLKLLTSNETWNSMRTKTFITTQSFNKKAYQ